MPFNEGPMHAMNVAAPPSSFVPLPTHFGDLLRLAGPPPAEALTTVDPLVKLDEPRGPLAAVLGGVCDPDGQLVLPLEMAVMLPAHLARLPAGVEAAAFGRAFAALPDLLARVPLPPVGELQRTAFGVLDRHGPLLYCRKQQRLFVAQEVRDGQAVAATLPETPADSAEACEVLIRRQGEVVALAGELAERDAAAHAELSGVHVCVTCPLNTRCFPAGDEYAYAVDRLVVVHAHVGPLVLLPAGAWRLDEAARLLGGAEPANVAAGDGEHADPLADWRQAEATAIERAGRRLIYIGEPGGRDLAEILRLKLALLADVLEQLDAAWRARCQPHLCWTEQTVRALWSRGGGVGATAWGFRALLRNIGWQPLSDVAGAESAALPYPPVFSEPALLPPAAVAAMRYFGEPRRVNVFVKAAEAQAAGAVGVQVLIEELGIASEQFCAHDVVRVTGAGWPAELTPTEGHDPADGAGVAMCGVARGEVGALRADDVLEGCECRWYPRFGEAEDLHAVGMLLLRTVLATDEVDGRRFFESIAAERDALLQACGTVGPAEREAVARSWIAERCGIDTPGALWTRRNVLYERAARAAVVLNGLPPALWQAVVSLALRMVTPVAGFGYCAQRGMAAPRSGGQLLPLLELRGLIGLLDDRLFGRRAPAAAVRAALGGGDAQRPDSGPVQLGR
jgi:hypothetical protein